MITGALLMKKIADVTQKLGLPIKIMQIQMI